MSEKNVFCIISQWFELSVTTFVSIVIGSVKNVCACFTVTLLHGLFEVWDCVLFSIVTF